MLREKENAASRQFVRPRGSPPSVAVEEHRATARSAFVVVAHEHVVELGLASGFPAKSGTDTHGRTSLLDWLQCTSRDRSA